MNTVPKSGVFMIYLALLLILSGLLIVIAALFIEKTETRYSAGITTEYVHSGHDSYSAFAEQDSVEIILPQEGIDTQIDEYDNNNKEEDIFISFTDHMNGEDEQIKTEVGDDWGIEQDEYVEIGNKFEYKKNSEPSTDSTESGEYMDAIMFDDRSNIIDYESGEGIIDPTFAKYKSIKRIGKGRLEADSDGLNFFLGEKLYRFDFHKVYDIWSGKDYIALPLKGTSNVKLFLLGNADGFPERVDQYFKEYEKGI